MKDEMDLEKILKEIGVGRYQLLICFALCLTQMFSNLSPLAFIFTAYDVNYRCAIPECENPSSISKFEPGWLPYASPFSSTEPESRCLRYTTKKTNSSLPPSKGEGACPSDWFNASTIVECPRSSLIFETKEKTAVNEFGLFCEENRWKIFMVGTANTLGQFFGLPVSGVISDKFGRKSVLIIMTLSSAICGVAQSYTGNYWTFVFLEGLNAFVSVGLYGASLILAVELLHAKRRTMAGGILCTINPIMGVILALIHKHTEDWRLTLRYCYFPGILFAAYFWLIPESIRWMSFHGKHEQVIKLLGSLAERNKAKFSDSAKIELSKKPTFENGKSITEAFFDILRNRSLIIRFLNSIVCWVIATYVYYGMSILSVNMSENKYLDFILALAIEIPGVPISAYMMEAVGRRITISSMYTIAAVALIFNGFGPENAKAKFGFFLLAKVTVAMAFDSLYVHTLEIYPTELRQSLLNLCSMVGRFGFILAVVNSELATWWKSLPVLVFAAACLICTAATLASPETLNKRLPDTVKESVLLKKADK